MKIAMITEGTYPYGFGGVSVWCDQLVRGMPGNDFRLVAIVATETEQMVWSLPGNVSSVCTVLLWGSASATRRAGRRGVIPDRVLHSFLDTMHDPSPLAQRRF